MILPANYEFPRPLELLAEEKEIIEPRDKLSVSQWAQQRRILSKKESPRFPGPWSNSLCPFLVEIMDRLSDIKTREVWLRKCAQSSGTECAHNWLGQTIEEDPAPFLDIQPDENLAKKEFRTRIKPMFESTPSLLRHLTNGDIRNLNVGQETELDRMFLFMGWAGSAVAMSSSAIQKVHIGEAAKCQMNVGNEVIAYELLRDRQKTFRDISKLFAESTPILTGDAFDQEYQKTEQHEYWLKCPFCAQYHIAKCEYIVCDHDSAGHLLRPHHYRDPNCSKYICPKCGKKWEEINRWAAVSAGIWAPWDCKVENGKIIGKVFSNPNVGYQVSSFMVYPGFLTITDIAYEWANAEWAWKNGNKNPRQNFINSWLGENWEEREKETNTDKLIPHIGNYEPDLLPAGVQMLTAGIDVQQDHMWYVVNGYGYRSEVWKINEGRLETGDVRQLANYSQLEELLYKIWPFAEDKEKNLGLRLSAIDCGDWQDVIFDFCAKMQRQGIPIIPVKGTGSSRYDIYTAVPIAGGTMKRFDLNVNNIKNRLYRLLYETKDSGPGYMHLHKDTSQEVLEHLSSEHQVPKRISKRNTILEWKPKADHKPNHLWDADVYSLAAAEIAGVRTLPDPTAETKGQEQKTEKSVQTQRPIKTRY